LKNDICETVLPCMYSMPQPRDVGTKTSP